ncbi:MAG: flagellar cap protein FliD N-terminal domain-containing protein, partial [Treponema sp.]|nr:flagellar cap protein FliD N-terminal domain-containing protein [Treponema sp.]
MADGLNIPGVSDKYKTNDLVESLMEVERIPLKREESNLETYKKQQDAWRGVNQKMSSLRDSVKSLYSFENPFSNRISSSSEEYAVTADAGREAEFGSFKIEVLQPAASDRFLSDEIDSDMQVAPGKYTYSVGEKKIDFNWKGGKLNDFVTALNRRGNDTIKASLIGVSSNKKSLLIESLKTGAENRLVFENQALDFAKKT